VKKVSKIALITLVGLPLAWAQHSRVYQEGRDWAEETTGSLENARATIVGTKTPGRLLSGSAFKAGFGYIVGLPVAAYLTWQGRMIEGNGVAPDVPVSYRLNNFWPAKTHRCKEH
jgi:hypothetical protein